jgi:acid phosphatase
MRRTVLILAAALLAAASAAHAVDTASIGTRALYSNLYVQTSAEYRACCLTIYACATRQLEAAVASAEPPPARPAVVMDLDETVLDNAAFQTFLYENDLEYTPRLWAEFEREGVADIGLVPGAKAFIERAEELGVEIIYLSNRNERNLMATRETLARVGLNAERLADRLYLRPDGASSSKADRRDAAEARYNVLMYFGDNLRDFSEVFRAPDTQPGDEAEAVRTRLDAVDEAACHWGVDWFVLPNPVYGEWEKLVPDDPVDVLRRRGEGAPE